MQLCDRVNKAEAEMVAFSAAGAFEPREPLAPRLSRIELPALAARLSYGIAPSVEGRTHSV